MTSAKFIGTEEYYQVNREVIYIRSIEKGSNEGELIIISRGISRW